MERRNEILELSFEFALDIIIFTELLEEQKKYIIARQLLKSGTSIGANVRESQNSESKADFIHKLKIAAKEAEETEYWLLLCQHSPSYPYNPDLTTKLISIKKLLSSIISKMKTQ
ncbi:MAG: four helix bundle protein [Paludibacter sp.]|jgi:four helix bundle protein|nr:four helix bundle protein [Paludibacter sp.]